MSEVSLRVCCIIHSIMIYDTVLFVSNGFHSITILIKVAVNELSARLEKSDLFVRP